MTVRLAVALVVLFGSVVAAVAQERQAAAPLVFFDIAGPDLSALRTFYEKVLGWTPRPTVGPSSNITVPVLTPALGGTLREDPAATLLYFGVDDVSATLRQVEANGGRIQQPRFAVPGVVVLGLFRDPAGNLLGLVEMKDGKPIVP